MALTLSRPLLVSPETGLRVTAKKAKDYRHARYVQGEYQWLARFPLCAPARPLKHAVRVSTVSKGPFMNHRFHTTATRAAFAMAALPLAISFSAQAQYAEATTELAALDPVVVTAALAPRTATKASHPLACGSYFAAKTPPA